ncbi:3-oxosteroid 1-dehydrogenase [Sphingopyxis panaciterrae]|uniref:FAD-dependent oxidoreductase n=1 Tax=Sphingopyxis panaciterrae TaxID=363841 RepID=UPI001FBAE6A1|nr:FAD-dependent oxidoreductase [Sphingopyxis panaciterrae]NIJ37633.1 3-oxosteroid 1-dehydrogenase [Sphingopyxis panaciterrae]
MMDSDIVDEAFDFVVVGSGAGSMCAALWMRAMGKSVVIVEKDALIGGTTARSGGTMWIPCNRFLAEDGVVDSDDLAMAYLDATVGLSENAPAANRERRHTYVVEAPRMLEFLIDSGIRLHRLKNYPDYYDERPGGLAEGRVVVADLFDISRLGPWADKLRPGFLPVPASHEEIYWLPMAMRSWRGLKAGLKLMARMVAARMQGARWVTAGAALQGRMLEAALANGVDIRVASPVSSLVEKNGRICGVVATSGEHQFTIGARLGVLVNAGGFAQNSHMRRRYMADGSARWTAAGAIDSGEMIEEMQRLGAAVAQMDGLLGSPMGIPSGAENRGDGVDILKASGQPDLAKPHAIVVDGTGVRYMNEGGSYVETCQNMRDRHRKTPAIPSWLIVDRQYMRKYMLCGTIPRTRARRRLLATGFVRQAPTIEALEAKIGAEPGHLVETIRRFNADVRKGKDTQFGRGARIFDRWSGDALSRTSPALGTIERPPFYAIEIVPGDVGTSGGVVTDASARVLRDDGSPIDGLYATGTSAASVMGRYAPGAGSSIGPSLLWAYVAAKHACADPSR